MLGMGYRRKSRENPHAAGKKFYEAFKLAEAQKTAHVRLMFTVFICC